ncbi:epimerase [Amedibacterium intestinale]|uniref:Epimerase n=1 Tax=Amedibacterium intestinale TaxID=2583452 RepID=A0A6N4TJA6_9FIRM|nr:NAD-dependent epimerase/dehydratase family protein [Amedibacterium intestinale]BBK22829.1 epimerase [Amedibacterium intestinale]
MKKILVLGGTRFFGKHLVEELLKLGYDVTIATRGLKNVHFSKKVNRIIFDRYNEKSIINAFSNEVYDVVYDNLAYSSNDIEILLPHLKYSKYIVTTSTAVYDPLEGEIQEEDFDISKIVYKNELRDKNRYAYGKRLVEASIYNKFHNENIIMVRFPFVIGKDDYTKRLEKYIESYIKNQKMYINNLYDKMNFISSLEAGKFLAFLSNVNYKGPINAASNRQLSIYDVLEKVSHLENDIEEIFKDKVNKLYKSNILLHAPYNDTKGYIINTDKAKDLGFNFSSIDEWIDDLILYLFWRIKNEE